MTATMLLGSLDHTPSEQLADDLSQWHTTALVLSEAGEHWDQVPKALGERIGGTGQLLKWAGRNKSSYRARFSKHFFDCVSDYAVHTRVVSARGATIRAAFPVIIANLGLRECVQQIPGQKPRLRFGPFLRARYGQEPEEWTCDLPERQAISLLFICDFLLRTHHEVLEAMKEDQKELDWVDWQLMHNKFPGDVGGGMHELFAAIMISAARAGLVSGTMRLGTFNETKTDFGNLLADNVAGLFSEKINRDDQTISPPPNKKKGCSFSWQVWETEK